AQATIDRITRYLVETNANHGGAFPNSAASDAVIDEARAACADFYHAARPEEIVFGANMTSLTFAFSRAFARTLQPGDTLVITRLDHDANVAPWLQIAEDKGLRVERVDFDVEDGTLRLETLEQALSTRPKLVAVGYASNALGTINPVKRITEMAHQAGALVYVDAVQYAPHGPMDVQDLGCDVLVSSAYKYFATHVGVLYARYGLLDEMRPYKVRPASNEPPGKWETGTGNFEGIAGVLGGLEYLASLAPATSASRREQFVTAMTAIQTYELALSQALLDTLQAVPGLRLYGLTDPTRLAERVPTFSFTLAGWEPRKLAEFLGERGIYVWDGNYYALSVTERLGLEGNGGMVRVGAVHYNTVEEIHRLGEVLAEASALK
ncbi:MAG TPA: cysteine desulfurase-like protein, partial [Anaerolineales bacterium]|nr:cysteine desulfurase-like protein [Anaerolineales bacterium]